MYSTPWQDGGASLFSNVVTFQISNQGSEPINAPWTLTITNPSYTSIEQAWNIEVQGGVAADGTATLVASQYWEALAPNSGNFGQVGAVIRASANSFSPTRATLNGEQCSIVTPVAMQ